jgi:hypothetical protein
MNLKSLMSCPQLTWQYLIQHEGESKWHPVVFAVEAERFSAFSATEKEATVRLAASAWNVAAKA